MLGDRLARHGSQVWLVNTGWTGGPYGVGRRIDIADTRAMVRAALSGELTSVPTYHHEIFGLDVPEHVPGVPDEILQPEQTWNDPETYRQQAQKLARMFAENFSQNFAGAVSPEVEAAGPH
jgi:phosphoenolpyruvate carboxykinase (ATP)